MAKNKNKRATDVTLDNADGAAPAEAVETSSTGESEVLEGVSTGDIGDTGDETTAAATLPANDVTALPPFSLNQEQCEAELKRLEDPHALVREIETKINAINLSDEKHVRESHLARAALKLSKIDAMKSCNDLLERKRLIIIRQSDLKTAARLQAEAAKEP